MNNTLTDERESIRIGEYLWLLYRHKWVVLLFLLVSVMASLWITAKTMPVYRSSATFIYDPSSRISQTLNMSSVLWFEMDPMRNNQIQIIQSRSMAESVADSIMRSPNADSLVSLLFGGLGVPQSNLRSSLIGMVRSSSSVSILNDTDFFVLSATGYSPAAAATMANLVVQTYYRRNLQEARGENAMVKEFLAEQLAIMEVELAWDEDSLTMFKEEHGIVDLSAETTHIVSNLSAFETAAATSRTEQGALQAQKTYYAQQVESGRAELADNLARMNSIFIAQLEGDIAVLESSRASLMARGGNDDDPAVISIDAEIDARRDALTQALAEIAYSQFPDDPTQSMQGIVTDLIRIESLLRAERIRESVLRTVVLELESSISQLPELELTLIRLERNRTVSEQIYLLLRTKFEEVRIAEAGQMGNVTIVDTALPGGMIKPNSKRNLILGIFAGLAAGIGFIVLKEQLDSSIKSPEDIEALDIPVMGVIPKVSRSETLTGDNKMSLIMITSPRKAGSEAYRDLRTSLRFSGPDKGIRSLLVTSAGPREGKSTTAGNLAVAIAQTGSKVLLVDTDLRRPVIHNIFGLPREPGFSEAIAGVHTIDEVIRQTKVDNLSVMTCGFIPHNPSELLGSKKFSSLLAELHEKYGMIIFDSPPVAVVTDAILLHPEVDATLVVVGAKNVDKRVLKSAWIKLQRASGYLVGAVLNGFDPVKMYTSYTYYTYRYHYYYDGEEKKKRRIKNLSQRK